MEDFKSMIIYKSFEQLDYGVFETYGTLRRFRIQSS